MKLPLFYPVALALIVAMVWLALRPGVERREAWLASLETASADGIEVSGDRLETLSNNDRASVELVGANDARVAIIGSYGDVGESGASGVYYFLPAEVIRALRSPALELLFEVRSPVESGSREWLARCFINGVIDTGWMNVEATDDWTVQSVRCPVGRYRGPEPLNVVFWSDATGSSGRIELRSIRIKAAADQGIAEPQA